MKKEISYKIAFWTIWFFVICACAFFIVKNAQWGIGDDAIIMKHTGSGLPFLPGDTMIPALGRFYPFAYLIYDVLFLFSNGYMSAAAHYWIHLVMFVLMSFSVALLFWEMFDTQKPVWRYSLSLLASFVAIFRLYSDYINCFSTIWNSYSLIVFFILFAWLFHKNHKKIYGIIALVVINYFVYCSEVYFVIPLVLGLGGIVFQRLRCKDDLWFYYSLLGSGLLYLVLYGIIIYPHIVHAYDGAHGSQVSLVSNAVHMLIGNKILLLAIAVFVVRLFDIIKNRSAFSFYDNLLLAAAGYCAACFVLKLNWTMYYNIGAMVAFPAVVFYCQYYLKSPITLAILAALVCLYGYKLPRRIMNNQKGRIHIEQQMNTIKEAYENGTALIWYAPKAEYNYDVEIRDWKRVSLCTYVQWLTHNPSFAFEEEDSFLPEKTGIWLDPSENSSLFPDNHELLLMGECCFEAGEIIGYRID